MSPTSIPSSFRDPSGFLFRQDETLYRQVNPVYAADYDAMMASGFYQAVTDGGLLIRHVEVDPVSLPGVEGAYRVLRPDEIPFVSFPYEWCFGQLKDAALLTLALEKRALDFGLSLKDASAYNVQFADGRPVFIDTLSFERYVEGRPWIAYQQFCRHFLAPLALMAYRHIDLGKLFRIYIDSVPLELASRLLPSRTRLRPGLLVHVHLHARAQARHADAAADGTPPRIGRVSLTGLRGLIASLEAAVHRLEWKPTGTEWSEYYGDTSYSNAAHESKADLVASFIDETAPRSVWDFGANTGVFSRLASERGIRTVAFDVDPAAVEKSYRRIRERGERDLLPLVMDLANPSTGTGWDEAERQGLRERGPADLVLALALVHHLAIGNNVPLERVARFFRGVGRALVVEFVPKSDSQVARLLATREDIFPDYTQDGFEKAFSSCFSLRRSARIEGSQRVLYLFERS
jgi:ribosomal protein L11 methylase PrmA